MNGSKRESPSTPTLSSMPQIIIEASQELPLPSPQLFPSEAQCHPSSTGIPEEPLKEEDEEEEDEEEEEEDANGDADDDSFGRGLRRTFSTKTQYNPARERLFTYSDQDSDDTVATSPTTKTPTVSTVVLPEKRPCSPHRKQPHTHQQVQRTSVKGSVPKRARPTFGSTTSLSDSGGGGGSIKGYDADFNELYDNPSASSIKKRRRLKGRLPLRSHQHISARPLPSDAERQKRRLAKARERRATLILGLIMAAFILAWLPFFVLYVLEALCNLSCNIGPTAFATAFWLGYCNSALNPIIYTIFNRDFRRAFKKILLK